MTDQLRPGVLFDLDGTLIDTNYLHTLAWSRALRHAGEWAPMNAIHRLVGMGADQLLPHLLGHDSPEATAARPGHYDELIGDAAAFPGAAEILRTVHDRGLAVVLATSASDDELTVLRKILDADDAIDAYTSGDDIDRSKPNPEVFVTAMRVARIDPRRALAVGDSVWDIRAARAAGIGCVAVESGGFSQHELSEAGALAVYQDVDEFRRQLNTSPVALLLPPA
jgi:HAD superfamily hydrolase (TIGR01509 family)